MATFTEIYYNGNEYKEMWLNGTKVWEKTGGEAVLPYPQYDIYGTIRVFNVYNTSSSKTFTIKFNVIDSSLPYSINGVKTKSYTTPTIPKGSYVDIALGLKNLYPRFTPSSDYDYSIMGSGWIEFEQFCLPKNVTRMEELFKIDFSPYYVESSKLMFQTGSPYTTDTTFPFLDTSNVTDMSCCFYVYLPDYTSDLYKYRPITFDLSNWDTSKVTTMRGMFLYQTSLTTLNVDGWDVSSVTNMNAIFEDCPSLTSLNLSSWNTSSLTSTNMMFLRCGALKEIHLENFDTRNVTSYSSMFSGVSDCTIYIGENWTLGTSSSLGDGTNLTFVKQIPIKSIGLVCDLEDTSNVTTRFFTITPSILPTNYNHLDLEIVYDSTYMSVNSETNRVTLKDGCQGLTHTVTYRSKTDNSISDTITFAVSQDLVIEEETKLIDFTTSTAPTLPSYMTLDGQGSYYFSHGNYDSVYGLVPNNNGIDGTTAYTRYKYVAPTSGDLTFTYRCYAETSFDYLTVHVDTSTSQPSYDSSTNRVLTTYGVDSYQDTDGTASVNVTSGTTYYIHIQYRKDGSSASGYDMGCIRKIELL